MRDIFCAVDADGDGRVTQAEFARAMPKLGVFITPQELELCWPRLDIDGNGTLSHDEFHAIVRIYSAQPRPSAEQLYSEDVENVVDHACASEAITACVEALLWSVNEVQREAMLRLLEAGAAAARSCDPRGGTADAPGGGGAGGVAGLHRHHRQLRWSNYAELRPSTFARVVNARGGEARVAVMRAVACRLPFRARVLLCEAARARQRAQEPSAHAAAAALSRTRELRLRETFARNREHCAVDSPFARRARRARRLRDLQLARRQLGSRLWEWDDSPSTGEMPALLRPVTAASNPLPAPPKGSPLRLSLDPCASRELRSREQGRRARLVERGRTPLARPRTVPGKLRLERRMDRQLHKCRRRLGSANAAATSRAPIEDSMTFTDFLRATK
eukprot:g2636.t1